VSSQADFGMASVTAWILYLLFFIFYLETDGRVTSNRKWKIENIKRKMLPGGVIGNTEVFGTSIPGSSPGRVVE
jgi:hypothetical protein